MHKLIYKFIHKLLLYKWVLTRVNMKEKILPGSTSLLFQNINQTKNHLKYKGYFDDIIPSFSTKMNYKQCCWIYYQNITLYRLCFDYIF